ncbi:N-acetylgalactosamine-6-sulfatase [Bacteroidia bacterium]|nr:N-acetylgalactosamine-6-sulfatase [Bacteroidia bacterium]
MNSKILITAGGVLSLMPGGVFAAQPKPNILLIVSDDQGYADYSRRRPDVRTPNLDALARQSMVFERFYVEPASAPTRASLLTGRCFIKTGVTAVHWGLDYISQQETLLPQVMKRAGYKTALIGKWHSGKGPGYLPRDRGFDHVVSATMHEHLDSDMCWNDTPAVLRGTSCYPVQEKKGWTLERMAEKAADYFAHAKEDGKPFFMQLAYVAPHAPWISDKQIVGRYLREGQSHSYAALNGLVEHLDRSIGEVLAALDKASLADNTIVIFFSDNGYIHSGPGAALTDGEIALRNPDSLRGTKGTVHEGGILSPMLVRWPGVVAAGSNRQLTHVTDILPTLAAIAGVNISSMKNLDGRSFRNNMTRGRYGSGDRVVVSSFLRIPSDDTRFRAEQGQDMDLVRKGINYDAANLYARNDRFKLVKFPDRGYALYDMENDMGETTDVSEQFPRQKLALEKAMKEWFADVMKQPHSYAKPTYYFGRHPYTVIYFNGAWRFTGDMKGVGQWAHSISATTSGSAAVWKISVARAGKYRVRLEATTGPAGVKAVLKGAISQAEGAIGKGKVHEMGTMELSTGDRELSFTLLGDNLAGTELWNIVLEEV